LADDDGKGVEDDEGTDEERDAGEDLQERDEGASLLIHARFPDAIDRLRDAIRIGREHLQEFPDDLLVLRVPADSGADVDDLLVEQLVG